MLKSIDTYLYFEKFGNVKDLDAVTSRIFNQIILEILHYQLIFIKGYQTLIKTR